MILRHIRQSLRILLKQKNIALINIFGLSISLACALFILLWVEHELSFENFHPDYKDLNRIEEDQYYSSREPYHVNVTPRVSGPVWMEEIPEIIDQCRIERCGGMLFNYEESKYFENDILAVDSSFFHMFGFELIKGDPASALTAPQTMIISEDIAKKYFGTDEAIGKSIKVDNSDYYTVTGVVKNPPENSEIRFNILFPFLYIESGSRYSDSWGSNSISTYVRLQKGAVDTVVNRKITAVTNKYKENNTIDYMVAPMHRVHLYSYFGYGKSPGAILYVYIFSAIALFVLIIACINFMNLSTARSSLRAKEIGLRKVNGASRKNLVRQYFLESTMQTVISIVLAFLLVLLFLNQFNNLSGKDISVNSLFTPQFLGGLLGILILTSFLSGIYPAFYLSSFNPIRAIREQHDLKGGSGLLRKILVIFQFSLSILLISGSIIVSRQLNFMRNADLGFNKYHLVNIPMRGGLNIHYETLRDEFLKNQGVEYVSGTMEQAYSIGSNSGGIDWPGKDPELKFLVSFTAVNFDFARTMGIRIKDGRGFSEQFQGDLYRDTTGNFLINSTLANIIGKEDVVGMPLTFMGIKGKVVGVMEDFNFSPLKNEIEPLAVMPVPKEMLWNMLIRLKSDDVSGTLSSMEEEWNEILPQYPFEYSFVDEEIDNMYRSEQRMATLIKVFTVVAIIIACLGLFALASFTAERRIKEIGIRKSMGAMEGQITVMMVRDFTMYILISLLIAIPGIWLLARWWLNEFYFRIELKPGIFILASVITISVSVLTVIYHAMRTARSNPVLALRYE